MTFVVVGIFVALILPSLVPTIAYISHRQRFHKQWLDLLHRYFTGHHEVLIDPIQVNFPEWEIRKMARIRGYWDMGRIDLNRWMFRRAENPLWNAMQLEHTAQGPPGQGSPRRQRKLITRFHRSNHVWVQPSEVRMSIHDIVRLAEAQGLQVTRVLGDHSDPILLLSRYPVHRLDETVEQGTPSLQSYVAAAGAQWLGVIVVAAVGILLMGQHPLWIILLVPLIGVRIVGSIYPFIFQRPDAAQRMTWIIRKFDGSFTTQLRSFAYCRNGAKIRQDGLAIADVASEMGYLYFDYEYSYWMRRRAVWRSQIWRYMRADVYGMGSVG